ncbi:MAG: hypothetical protein ABIF85_00155 [Nanoarchaeota archaeon]|nr:hypothetical protein [Nanoarchaeota archaeon]MBU4300057.1 hypothetical protein [Nanoarchaeota archaeon]MBU4451858.1 hypothetical protein [Nanoarchaeota archaeon]MCG2724406.1 hypothetical protein [archaeon]
MRCNNDAEKAIKILKRLKGLGKEFVVLSDSDKKAIAQMPEEKNHFVSLRSLKAFLFSSKIKNVINRGVIEVLSREITIAFSHNEKFRPPPCAIVQLFCKGKIVGEMNDSEKKFYNGTKDVDNYILPPVPFPELDGAFSNVCSASPGYVADAFLRTRIKVAESDATLFVGFNLKR